VNILVILQLMYSPIFLYAIINSIQNPIKSKRIQSFLTKTAKLLNYYITILLYYYRIDKQRTCEIFNNIKK